jgi:hypothetical protein
MLALFRFPSDRRLPFLGRVSCPIRAIEPELDVCAGCQWLYEMSQDPTDSFVRCRPDITFQEPTVA